MADPRLRLGGGARAVEELLLEELDELLPASADDLSRPPVRIVVPSRALRLHLQCRLVERRGALLGLEIHSLRGFALALLEAAGEQPRSGAGLLVPLARRAASEEPALRGILPLEGGPRSVAAAVRDLLDAGLDEGVAEAALDALAEEPAGPQRARAEALLRSASRVLEQLESLGLAAPASVLRQAADLFMRQGDELLPSQALLVHGFADATGAATDLIQALLRHEGARLYLDRPPDPARPGREDAGNAFAERFAERALSGASRSPALRSSTASELELLAAPGPRAEAAAIAVRVRAWIDDGTPPERIGLLVRQPGSQLAVLRRELDRAGVPFSCGQAAGPPGPLARRAEALRRLLLRGGRAGVETWMDAVANLRPELRSDRLAAWRVLGAPRLRDLPLLGERLSSLAGEDGLVRLALRRGLAAMNASDEDEELRAVAPHRKVPVADLEREVERAKRGLELLESRPERATAPAQVEAIRALLTGPLGWRRDDPADAPLLGALDELAASLPGQLELEREDADALLDETLAGLGRLPAGGAGGGVQLLGVMEARALSFERVVLAGLNRDLFPRVVREDPLLPDALRRRLNGGGAGVLPDLAEKAAGVDEERFLFAQALSSAPCALLSTCSTDEDGRPRPPSPLLERLRLERLGGEEPERAAHPHAAPASEAAEERPALDQALLAALHGGRAQLAGILPAAVAEAERVVGSGIDPAELADLRCRLLDEFDPAPGSPARRRLGPFHGFVGPVVLDEDPRREAMAVTRVEDLARCGWRSFLSRILRVEAAPDPLGALPALSNLLLGQVVHEVLEEAVKRALGDRPERLEDCVAAGARSLELPVASALRELFEAAVDKHARAAGLPLGAFATVVVERAMELFDRARSIDWADGPVEVLGAELAGVAAVPLPGGGERPVHFKADRVDLVGGALRLVDYKTGSPPAEQKTDDKRRDGHLAKMREGRALQAAAYALAGGEDAEGRLLFLGPKVGDHARLFTVRGDEQDFAAVFRAVVGVVDAAWTSGSFLPRLDDGQGERPKTCGWCEMKEACLQGDSGSVRRLRDWAESAEEARGKGREPQAPSRQALDLFELKARATEASS